MELAIKGQIGQPAACMMENKGLLRSSGKLPLDYGARWRAKKRVCWRKVHHWLPTIVVDNFGEKCLQNCCQAMIDAACDALMTN